MGIFDALTSAVAGLQAQSFALQNISGDIANSQTTAFKETDTSFQDLVSAAALNQQTAGGVISSSVSTNTVQGAIQSASVSTDMAINGDGYFVVARPNGFADNQPTFSNVDAYTRRGDFQTNSNGYLVNGAGYYLMGIQVDPTTGNALGSVPQVLQFNNNFVPAQQTTKIQYQANLPSSPASLLSAADFEANPVAGASVAAEVQGTGANLLPDAKAVGVGSVPSLTNNTLLSTLGMAVNDTITVNDGTNTTTYTVAAGDKVSDLIAGLNGGSATVTASLTSTGNLQLKGNTFTSSITVGGTAASDIGFGAGQNSFQPVNLLTQSAVGQGQTLTVAVGTISGNPPTNSGTPQIITFGTQAGQVATLAQLQTAVQGLTGVTGALDTATGNITLTAVDPSDDISIGGTASVAKFGIQNSTAFPANGTVIANDESTFDNQSVDGGSITTYDSKGDPVNVDFRWAKTSSVSNGGTDSWQLFYQVNTAATGTQAAWQNVGTTFSFDSNGQLSPPISGVTLQNLTVNGDALGDVQLQFGSNGLTQFANASGTAQVNGLQQNGFAAGALQSISVDSQDRVVGTFSNGQTVPLALISLATFNGQDSLQALDGGAYAATPESGPPISSATGKIVGGSLEASNVDIATQFSKLIVAQQAYSANAKVMSTSDQMIQSLLQVIQ